MADTNIQMVEMIPFASSQIFETIYAYIVSWDIYVGKRSLLQWDKLLNTFLSKAFIPYIT